MTDKPQTAPDRWTGIAKLVEECGEVLQLCGKLMAYPDGAHPDKGGDMVVRMEQEIGDLYAALDYFFHHNKEFSHVRMHTRRVEKTKLFDQWIMAGVK